MTSVLNITGLTKKFGRLTAVDNLELNVPKGSVFGILGPNGSGKSTTLGMVLGVVNPTSGSYDWFEGEQGHQVRKKIGAILEAPCFYHYLSAAENLKVAAAIKETSESRINEVLDRVGLLSRKDDPFRSFSLGMKQRLAIGSALLSDPEVMILDEPTNGLDPQGIAEIRNLIIDLANEGRTIITASHMLSEVQRICTDFAVLKSGKKIYQGKVNELDQEKARYEIWAEDEPALTAALVSGEFISSHRKEGDAFVVMLDNTKNASDLNAYLIEKGVVLNRLVPQANSLEKRFLEILKAEDHA
ncbi:ATP-binding cassette domain-containing protein [Cryomorphaceae bacterium 1068]|nr:ATP-binding cassette domain-containing protein [Cryomorphaceae bacterium 1068]